jgi:hypothetical protein
MIRKSMPAVVLVLVVLSVSTIGWAQDLWKFNEFSASFERFLYEVVSLEEMWDEELFEDVFQEILYYEQWELLTDDDELEVTMGYRYWLPLDEAKESMTFLGSAWDSTSMWNEFAGLGEYTWLSMAASDFELEVGNTMQLFDGSRITVVGEQTVAGLQGYLIRKYIRDADENGNRIDIVTSEWVIAPDVGLPLAVTLYEYGEAFFSKTLVEYERR